MNPNGTTIGPNNGTSFQVHPLLAPFWDLITDQQVIAILGGVVGFWGGVFGCGLIFLMLVAYRRWKKRRFNELNNPTVVEDGHPEEPKRPKRDQSGPDQHATSPNDCGTMRSQPTTPKTPKVPNFQSRPKSPQPQPRPKPEGVSNKKKSHVANLPRLPKPIPSITHTLH